MYYCSKCGTYHNRGEHVKKVGARQRGKSVYCEVHVRDGQTTLEAMREQFPQVLDEWGEENLGVGRYEYKDLT